MSVTPTLTALNDFFLTGALLSALIPPRFAAAGAAALEGEPMSLPASLRARRRAAVLEAVAVVGFTQFAQGGTKTWIGGTGNWSLATAWSPNNRPGSGDLALVKQSGAVVTY